MTLSPDHSTGVHCIDEEHRELVNLINKIHEGLHKCAAEDEIKKLFRRLADWTLLHFQHEEGLFDGLGYSRATAHTREHKHLMVLLSCFQNGVDLTGRTAPIDEQLDFLRSWLVDHIVKEDKPLGAYLGALERSKQASVCAP